MGRKMKKLILIIVVLFSLCLSLNEAFAGPGLSSSGGPHEDGSTNATIQLDQMHHEIHSGDAYVVSGTTILGSGATEAFAFAVPTTTKRPHMSISLTSTGILNFYLMEGSLPRDAVSTLTAGGTPYNHDRGSANTSGCTVGWIRQSSPPSSGAVVGSHTYGGGVTIYDIRFGTNGQAQTTIGGQANRENELILKSGTTYVFWFTSGAASNNISYNLNWYEHTPNN
jgi:hypothetical protein